MQTSPQAIATLEHEEGVVLRAYLCPAGVWTIGAGLTAASGVVRPGPGMIISEATARQLLQEALSKNYEPRVARAMPDAVQHAFDAGVLFDWNTGAIHRASWVKLWRKAAERAAIWAKFKIWNKGGGKVLPGLVKRRHNEFAILMDGRYPVSARNEVTPPLRTSEEFARWSLSLASAERKAALAGFATLGFAPVGQEMPAQIVRDFQRAHGLTEDAIIGRATLSALQRRLDAGVKTKAAGAGAAVSAPVAVTDHVDQLVGLPHAGSILLAGAALYALVLLWRYRDAAAAKVQGSLPRVSAFLRSV